MNKNPQQTEATRQNLKTAYYQMLCEGQKITVDKLCKRAGYNRCTFYRYYADTNQLLEEIEKSIAEHIRSNIREKLDKHDLADFIDSMTVFYEKNGDIICMLLEKNPSFLQIMKEEMAPIILKHCQIDEGLDENLVISFISAAISQTLVEWYRTGKKTPIHEVSKFMIDTLGNGILKERLR